jgi:hypothetical protein
LTDAERELLFKAAAKECEERKDYVVPVIFDMASAVAVIGCLQLALRHPRHPPASASVIRTVIDSMAERMREGGFVHYAKIIEMGYDPGCD